MPCISGPIEQVYRLAILIERRQGRSARLDARFTPAAAVPAISLSRIQKDRVQPVRQAMPRGRYDPPDHLLSGHVPEPSIQRGYAPARESIRRTAPLQTQADNSIADVVPPASGESARPTHQRAHLPACKACAQRSVWPHRNTHARDRPDTNSQVALSFVNATQPAVVFMSTPDAAITTWRSTSLHRQVCVSPTVLTTPSAKHAIRHPCESATATIRRDGSAPALARCCCSPPDTVLLHQPQSCGHV